MVGVFTTPAIAVKFLLYDWWNINPRMSCRHFDRSGEIFDLE
ncbi:hypothetical protein EV200_102664 [Pedobacter psychrotolerans]|uniref:Uncharacterized protein n=1 Tax=Pedobacter psychrotolerans TaxID=1843235 RepID=A0A4R2HIU1_9SPHI|nr:hypothetical protein EV200_102664 [Pedobacter psychrotolerans]